MGRHPSRLLSRLAAALALLCPAPAALAQPDPDFVREQVFDSFDAFRAELDRVTTIADPARRTDAIDGLWDTLTAAGQVPYAQGDMAALLYRGSASTVAFRGDFNGWGVAPAQRLGASDVWILQGPAPADARIDYKLFLNGHQWLLDPDNPLQMPSGFGPNSELRMPGYVFPRETVPDPAKPAGRLGPSTRIDSTQLGYGVNYRVYTPAGYDDLDDLPVVYVTDGHEYADPALGALPVVLDNLIADGRLQPVVAVFIDPRNPLNPSQNRRMTEYVGNHAFARFVARELVPAIDRDYDTRADRSGRTILGTSLGGLFAAFLGAREADTFENLAIQSPAFWTHPQIYDLYRNPALTDRLDIAMAQGTINDGDGGFTLADILTAQGHDFTFFTDNQGHSWGQWRGQLDTLLIDLVGPVPEPASLTLVTLGLPALLTRRRPRHR